MSCEYCGGLMVRDRTLTELANEDFRRARWRQRFGQLVARLRGRSAPGRLACFAEGRGEKTVLDRRPLGVQTVELAKIKGSVGRCWDFDRAFMPVCSCRGERWRRVDRALREGKQLPPIKLYKLGGQYFVEDGNHRVSVSRYRGFLSVEAEVTELVADDAVKGVLSDESGGGR